MANLAFYAAEQYIKKYLFHKFIKNFLKYYKFYGNKI